MDGMGVQVEMFGLETELAYSCRNLVDAQQLCPGCFFGGQMCN